MTMIDFHNAKLLGDIRAHAAAEYPKEACGIVAAGQYVPMANVADDPLHDFRISERALLPYDVEAVVHSHPDGPDEPTAADMSSQMSMDVPFGLCVSHDGSADLPWFWGGVPAVPLLGRSFRHGPSGTDGRGDCYALIKDWYAQERGIELPEFPRDNDWWRSGGNLYEEGFALAGFRAVQVDSEPLAGDVALITVPRSDVVNHAAVYIGDGLILHHLYNRLSVREPAGRWAEHVVRWVRHD